MLLHYAYTISNNMTSLSLSIYIYIYIYRYINQSINQSIYLSIYIYTCIYSHSASRGPRIQRPQIVVFRSLWQLSEALESLSNRASSLTRAFEGFWKPCDSGSLVGVPKFHCNTPVLDNQQTQTLIGRVTILFGRCAAEVCTYSLWRWGVTCLFKYGMVWYGTVCNGMVWYGMVWHDMIWYDVIWYDMIRYDNMTWYDMTWYDMTWYDMTWHDMTWCCTLWWYTW